MTDSQILYISKADAVLVEELYKCKLNLSDEEITANTRIAVIGGIHCEGEFFTSLRLFKCKSLSEKYIVELLRRESIFDYVLVQIHETVVKLKPAENSISSIFSMQRYTLHE
jgi:hypothetical protein